MDDSGSETRGHRARKYEHCMREPNLIELTSAREISRIIQYLDPDFRESKRQGRRHADFEGVIMLILLLGGVITCFVVMILHVSE